MNARLSYCYPWHLFPDELFPLVAKEFLAWGVDTFVFTNNLARQCLENPQRIGFLKTITRDMGIRFVSMHSPFGKDFDLNVPEYDRRPQMLKDHIRCMEIAAEFGSQTYTMHVGAWHHLFQHTPWEELHRNAEESLEQLLPAAEKLGIVIAVENAFEPPNSPREVRNLVDRFASSPAIGVCYDTGHAHFMAPYPWKDPANYSAFHREKTWWEHGIEEEPNHIEILQDQIVTCHIHDNSGYDDDHSMPFDGTLDWDVLMPKLRACPRMLEFQTEVSMGRKPVLPTTPVSLYSIKGLVETFRKLGFD